MARDASELNGWHRPLITHERLAELYEKTGNETQLSREKRVLNVLSEWRQMQKTRDDAPAAN